MKPNWRTYVPDESRPWCDVVPIDDEIAHTIDSFEESRNCECQPEVEYADKDGVPNDYPLVIHSAHDGRECIEKAEEIKLKTI